MVACATQGDERLTALVEGDSNPRLSGAGLKGGKLFIPPELQGRESCQSLAPMTP